MHINSGNPTIDQSVREAVKIIANANGVNESDALSILVWDGLKNVQQKLASSPSKGNSQAATLQLQTVSNVMKNRQQTAKNSIRNIN